uniref:small ribosomal subunit protein uS5m n=1 Tax=Myxine glutinosa TaxID=7769 RepID=UPI00358E617F
MALWGAALCCLRRSLDAERRAACMLSTWLNARPLPPSSSQDRDRSFLWIPDTYLGTVQQPVRYTSFFGKLTADLLWKGALAEKSSRKGRGKRSKKRFRKDLNKGQRIGEGQGGFLWPGLNIPVEKPQPTMVVQRRDPERQNEILTEMIRQRDSYDKRRKSRIQHERGWTGSTFGGRSIGPPDPGPRGESFEDFDSRVIEVRNVSHMTAKEGRTKMVRALVVVGNGKGAVGFAIGKAPEKIAALRKAKNMAIKRLQFIERYNDHTIYHDIVTTFHKTTISMKKKSNGYGLRCHRAIITICKLIGIRDLYARVVGSTTLINVAQAFLRGLQQQETHQMLADQKGLHVVEMRKECGPLPILVASPTGPVVEDPEPEEIVSSRPLLWHEVKSAHKLSLSPWSKLKRTPL